ncbi:MAG: S41 family peptidase [Muribaculaceae bacterium]|nr:S41 family peptidase [Muribaculaceae bacterium]MDE6643679.1 S41 family peptidase [Muribaculaceae bacterium]
MNKIKYTLLAGAVALMPISVSAQFNNLQKLQAAERIITNLYVDSVDENKIVEEAIVAMLKTLDPHSLYSDAAETKELTTPLDGSFSGIGIQFNMLDDTLRVIQTVVGGPSEKVGLLPGDRILTANDSLISGAKRKNSSVLNILRGPKGSPVNVTVLRRGVKEPIHFRIIRDDIPIESVVAAYMVTPEVGYISITNFAEKTPEELKTAMTQLKKQGMKHLILDLEDNGGGYMNSAVEMAEEFLAKDDMIVSTRSPRTTGTTEYRSSRSGMMPDGRLVVMVNQYSASASEILSGAIQDHDRGVIVGRRTFGKGLVQRPIPFPDGSMIRLTVARYYTPSGRTIQKPYNREEPDDYRMDIYHRFKAGEFTSADSVHFDQSQKVTTLKNGRTIYGGGGIMPDVFVPIDTTLITPFYRDIVAKGVLNRFVMNYVDANRKDLTSKYKNEDSFVNQFQVTPKMIDDIKEMAVKDSIKIDESQVETSKKALEANIKGLIGRDLFVNGTYSRIVNPLDPIFVEAVAVITDPERYNEILKKQPK